MTEQIYCARENLRRKRGRARTTFEKHVSLTKVPQRYCVKIRIFEVSKSGKYVRIVAFGT